MSDFCKYLPPVYRSNSRKNFKSIRAVRQTGSGMVCTSAGTAWQTHTTGNIKHTTHTQPRHTHIPKSIDVQEYNIFHIDSKIKEILSAKISGIDDIKNDLARLIWIAENDDEQKLEAENQLKILRRRLRDLESTLELTLYIFQTADILDEYRKLLTRSGARSFMVRKHNPDQIQIDELVRQYLSIAYRYIELENVSCAPKRMVCKACGSYEFRGDENDALIFVCEACHTEIQILDSTPNFKDTDRVNMSSKYKYSCKGHFIDAMKRFQGIQNTDPKKIQAAVDIIVQEIHDHGLTAEQGLSNSVTKDHIYMFMSEKSRKSTTNLSKHYDDLNLIFYIITGVECPNISHISDGILEDFNILEVALEKVKDPDRINSLSVNYKLYKLLQRHNFPCKKDDFYILKTKAKEDEHDEKMKEAYEILGWDWIPT